MPNNLGYGPEKAPQDNYYMLPVIERLAEWKDTKGTMVGVLAESWEADPKALTFTWHLRKGVKFHDGTDWNAEACRWNFQLALDASLYSQDESYLLRLGDGRTMGVNVADFADGL
jgi:peptide/nickel transport system substrate-binding protein